MKIYLLKFDGTEMFYDGCCRINIVKVFEYSTRVKNPYHKLHRDLFVHKKYDICDLFRDYFGECLDDEDRENVIPSHIVEKIKNNNHRKIHRKFLSYYRKREDEFFADLDKTWENNEINSYTFVDNIDKLFDIMNS